MSAKQWQPSDWSWDFPRFNWPCQYCV